MLTRFRIEVEEETAQDCVDALWKYEHALVQQEVRRYRHLWPVTLEGKPEPKKGELLEPISAEGEYPTPEHPWEHGLVPRWFYNELLGRELAEEVIEYDESLPGYRARRVVHFVRLDTRRSYQELVLIGIPGISGGNAANAVIGGGSAAPLPTLSRDEPDRGSP